MCSDGVIIQSMEEISFLLDGFTHCPCSSQWPWVFFLHKHPRPSGNSGSPLLFSLKGSVSLAGIAVQTPKLPVLLLSKYSCGPALFSLCDGTEVATGFCRTGLGH